ncbi:hypothetical protein Xmau_02982 [Xenorhabdus mauleonii]|uniref:Uncharacterized protein n=1 Tax=Xenorhabdus mauleonii TaxID=351675 RepID=A0A1I3SAL5_9GAMM|nr:hypothetical protein [Xenorhabdus mauleonii]PHM39078.1 hypothetical protein Xmau_02982 [Xenorhabdus mauleonii]SFJ54556.1 hypothetical protein SAMN05421680_1113 [Xenorhabdus mauleonii]
MFDIYHPFGSKYYQPFSWNTEEISFNAYSSRQKVAVRSGFAVLSEHQLAHPQLSFITENGIDWQDTAALKIHQSSEVMKLHNLVICELPQLATESAASGELTLLSAWQLEIVRSQLEWIERWTQVLMEHAAQRKVGASTLLSVPSIRVRLGQIMQHHALLVQCLALGNWSAQQALTDIEGIVDALIKTAGGRAMLQHGLVEMNSLFAVLNLIYLG